METLRLSVLVICYNQENYIRQTIESILNQEHNYKYELIICDDASKDCTPNIILEYYEKYHEIIKPILREKNLGLIGNYYDGISRTSGEYIMVCAGDDYWLPGKVVTQIEYMDKHKETGLCCGNVITLKNENELAARTTEFRDYTFNNLIKINNIYAPTICIRSFFLKRYLNEIKPDSKGWLMEDYPMILWFSINSQIQHIDKNMAVYRILNESISHIKNVDKLLFFRKSEFFIRLFFLQYFLFSGQKRKLTPEIESNRLLFRDLMTDFSKYKTNSKFRNTLFECKKKCNFDFITYIYQNIRIYIPIINRIHFSLSYRLKSLFNRK